MRVIPGVEQMIDWIEQETIGLNCPLFADERVWGQALEPFDLTVDPEMVGLGQPAI
jgi:hypothetical protein